MKLKNQSGNIQLNPVERKRAEKKPAPSSNPVQLQPGTVSKTAQFQFNGRWLPALDDIHIGAQNYSEVENMRPTDSAYESVEGYTKIADDNATAATHYNLYHFHKPGESHVLNRWATSGAATYISNNQTAIPSAGAETGVLPGNDASLLSTGRGSFANVRGFLYHGDDGGVYVWGGNESEALSVLGSDDADPLANMFDYTDNVKDTTLTMYVGNAGASGERYLFIGSPYNILSVKFYVSTVNAVSGTIAAAKWSGTAWVAATISSDSTTVGGVPFAQNGTVTLQTSDAYGLKIIKGQVLKWLRLDLNTFTAEINKITVGIPLQTAKETWNGSPVVCTSFQAYRSSVYEDYTFLVEGKDSTGDSVYAAKIGGLTSSDKLYLVFDVPVMGVDVTMLGSHVNAAAAKVSAIAYWDGDSYTATTKISDTTLDAGADSSFSQSGTITWARQADIMPREIFGIRGYVYEFTLDGTLTTGTGYDGTVIDYLTGIPSPTYPNLSRNYNLVASYASRLILIDGNRLDFSQTNAPWIFNGVDAALNDDDRSKFVGDSDNIVAATSIFNRYGSNLVESFLMLKGSSAFVMSGVQPNISYPEPFIIKQVSDTIGIAAPMTLRAFEMEVSEGLTMRGAVWLANTGVYFFKGDVPERIPGVENYFDPSKAECINYSYIQNSVLYIDQIHSELNLCFPKGSSTTINEWLVFNFKHKKWYRKEPTTGATQGYPQLAAPVFSTIGIQYNYAVLNGSGKDIVRLDNGNEWVTEGITIHIATGYFSPPMDDEFGMWTRSRLRGLKFFGKKEDDGVTVSMQAYADGVAGTAISISLDPASGIVAKNSNAKWNYNADGDYYKLWFSATVTDDYDKATFLGWAYNAQKVRED